MNNQKKDQYSLQQTDPFERFDPIRPMPRGKSGSGITISGHGQNDVKDDGKVDLDLVSGEFQLPHIIQHLSPVHGLLPFHYEQWPWRSGISIVPIIRKWINVARLEALHSM